MSLQKEKFPIKKRVLGWIAVSIVTLIAAFWAFWGGIENFHEGWYSESIWQNLFMMVVRYWSFAAIFVVLGLLGLRFRKTTAVLSSLLGVFVAWFLVGAGITALWLMINIPFIILGLLIYYGEIPRKGLAKLIIIGVPAMILIITSVEGFTRVNARVDDGNYGARQVEGNGVCLVWAPEGPGWPGDGATYEEAQYICAHLNEDGTSVLDEEVNIWRLPTIDEAVRSMTLHNENAGGEWDADTQMTTYELSPDKETPLWKTHSPVLYYWTSSMAGEGEAYIIVYHGGVFTQKTDLDYGNSMSFRAVKDCGQ